MIAGTGIAGYVLCVALFLHLQRLLQVRLAHGPHTNQPPTARALVWNCFILLDVYTFAFALAGAAGAVVCLVLVAALFWLNRGLLLYFGRVVTLGDLASVREAAMFLPDLLRHRRYAVSAAGWVATALLALFGAVELNRQIDFQDVPVWPPRGLSVLLALLAGIGILYKAMHWPVLGDTLAASWTDQNANARRLGYIVQFMLLLGGLARTPRAPSSHRHVDQLLRTQQASPAIAKESHAKPDLIVLMMESLADLTDLGVPLVKDPLAKLKQADDGKASGRLRVKVIGGNTCDTEFEVLTGIEIGERGVATQPFMRGMNRQVYSVAHALRRHGYRATAVHPFHRWFYNRDRVYQRFGMEEFLSDESFVGAERLFGKVSDEAFVNKVVASLQDDRPNFLFGVSILGHGPYTEVPPPDAGYLAQGNIHDITLRNAVNHYCCLMAHADDALEQLRMRLLARKKPFVLVIFGDHVPVFSTDLRGKELWEDIFRLTGFRELADDALTRTPVFILSNVDGVASRPLTEINASDLMAEVLERVGLVDPCAFGVLRGVRLDDQLACAYAHDTVHGRQRLTAQFLMQSDGRPYRAQQLRYQSLAGDQLRIAALSEAIDRKDREHARLLYAQFSPQDVLYGDASLLWALMEVRHGIDDPAVRQAFDAAAARATDPFYALYHRIEWDVSLGNLDSVQKDVTRAVSISPGRVHELRFIAQQLFELKNFRACEAILDAIVAANGPLGPEAVIWASLKLDDGHTDAQVARTLIEASEGPDPFWAHFHCIRLFSLRGDQAAVGRHVATALNQYPDRAPVLVELAQEEFSHKRIEAALAILDPIAERDLEWSRGHLLWGALRLDLGTIDLQVERILTQAASGPAGNFWSRYHCIRLFCRQGNLHGIAHWTRQVLTDHDDMVAELLALAHQEFLDQRASAALALLDVIADADRDLGNARTLWASLRIDANRVDEAVGGALERATQEPDAYWAWYHRIRFFAHQNDFAGMDACRDAAVRLEPERAGEIDHLLAQLRQ